MSGTYTVGNAPTDNYTTLELAVSSLTSNGMCGSVRLDVRSGTYNTALNIPVIPGNTATNKLTIRSMTGFASSVILTRGISTSADNYTVKLDGANNVQFDDLTISRTATTNYAAAALINDTMYRVAFNNVAFTGVSGVVDISMTTGSLLSVYTKIDSLLINDCQFNYGYSSLFNANLSSINYMEVLNSTFSNMRDYAITAPTSGMKINFSDNVVQHNGSYNNSTTTFFATGYPGNILLDGNKFIHNDQNNAIPNSETIVISAPASALSKVVIINNYINNKKTYMNSINLYGIDSVFVSNNTLRAMGTNEIYSNCGYVHHFNNISHNTSTRKNLTVSNVTNWNSDYNCYYSISTSLPFSFNSTVYGTLVALTSASGQEQHSLFHSPSYVNAYTDDEHIYDIDLDGKGIQLAYVEKDIDGQFRQDPPDVGCDEFYPPAVEAKLFSFQNYGGYPCPETLPLTCKIKNCGTSTITSIKFKLTVGGTVHGYYTWNGSVASADTMEIQVTDFNFEDLQAYSIQLEISQVNDQTDAISANNSITASFITRMQGLYTIGSSFSDFINLEAAYEKISIQKTCGTVVFELIDGVHYTTFASINSLLTGINEDSVIVRPKHPPVDGQYNTAIIMHTLTYTNCAKWFFEDLLFHDNADDNDAFVFNYSKNIGFNRCIFKTQADTYADFVAYSTGHIRFDNSKILKIKDCVFEHGHTAMRSSGSTQIHVEKNEILADVVGLYILSSDSVIVTDNNLKGDNKIEHGIMLVGGKDFSIHKNRISTVGGPALTLYSNNAFFANTYKRQVSNNSLITSKSIVMQLGATDDTRFDHNSILGLNSTGTDTFSLVLFMDSYASCDFFRMRNNIFKNHNSGPVYYGSLPVNDPIVNRNIYDNSLPLEMHNVHSSWVQWQNLGYDLNSVLAPVNYLSPSDLHVAPDPLLNAGAAIADIPRDQDDRIRNSTPTCGAFEVTGVEQVDVELLTDSLPEPVCGTDGHFLLYFRNLGPDTLFNARFSGKFNVEDTLYKKWEGSLPAGQTAFVDFGVADNFLDSINHPVFRFIPATYQSDLNTSNHIYTSNYTDQKMSGDYIIGGGDMQDFFNLEIAVAALKKRGMCDTVRFLIHHESAPGMGNPMTADGEPQFRLESIDGLADNLLVIQALDTALNPHILAQMVLRKVKNVVFRSINFDAHDFSTNSNLSNYLGDYVYAYGEFHNPAIYIYDTVSNITVEDCQFYLYPRNDGIVFGTGQYKKITVNGNKFLGSSECVTSYPTSHFEEVKVTNNQRRNIGTTQSYNWMIRLCNVKDLLVDRNSDAGSENDGTPIYYYSAHSLQLDTISEGLTISNNQFHRTCDVDHATGTATKPIKIYNNFFVTPTIAGYDGFSLVAVDHADIFHNTFKGFSYSSIVPASSVHSQLSPLRMYFSENIRLEKNWFKSDYGYNISSGITFSDYNLFKNVPDASAFEQHSIIGDPAVVDPRDMHLNENNTSLPIAPNVLLSHPTDIDGEMRNTLNSNYGADEYIRHDYNINVLDLTDTLYCPGSSELRVSVANYGLQPIDSFSLMYSIDGAIQDTVHIVQQIASNGVEEVVLAPVMLNSGQMKHTKVWSVLVNNLPDPYNLLDTISVTIYGALKDTLHVGAGQEYVTIQSAADTLMKYGICDTVWVHIEPGLYPESVVFNNIHMMDPLTNAVIIESALNDSSTVTIRPPMANPYGYGLRLQNMQHVAVKDLTIVSYTHADVYIDGNSNDISLLRNNIHSFGNTGASETNVEINTSSNVSAGIYRLLDNNIHGGITSVSIPPTSNMNDKVILHRNRIFPLQSANNVFVYNAISGYADFDIRENHITDFSTISTNDTSVISGNYFHRICGVQVNSDGNGGSTLIANNEFAYHRPSGGWTEFVFEINSGSNHTVNLVNNSVLFDSPDAIEGGLMTVYSSKVRAYNNQFVSQEDEVFLYAADMGNDIVLTNNNIRTNGVFHHDGSLDFTMAQYLQSHPVSSGNIAVDPLYLNDTVLIPSNHEVMSIGPSHPAVTEDILQVSRGLITDIGAYEISNGVFDIALTGYHTESSVCNDSVALYIVIKNNGSDTLHDISMDVTFDTETSAIDNALFLPGENIDTLFIGNFAVQGDHGYAIAVVMNSANNSMDDYPPNNTYVGTYQHQTLFYPQQMTICNGDSVLIGGIYASETGLYDDTLTSLLYGCDSIVRVQLDLLPTYDQHEQFILCNGETLWYENQPISTAGNHVFTFQSVSGCDSTVTVELILMNYIDLNLSVSVSGLVMTSAQTGGTYQWIRCDTGDSIPGATSQSWTATQSGVYAVIVSNGICTATSDCYQTTVVGLDEQVLLSLAVYPNPSTGIVHFWTDDVINGFIVYDPLGKEVLKSRVISVNKGHIDLKPFPAGAYLVVFSMENGEQHYRMIFRE